eukprot:CAMPEP_0178638966 /NCGR_PEP_ID=MMETSP0698-20121128/15198_1 /TAXON_ID=265572 /ORGANISM="Extubocellulus spinifer, Strain CCMP396" /LENGTH=741 /DNA_ID=CAMNT_0020279241 /DNA_START=114 /DNA_END=2338 /DNA_ORIENTATION=+
MGQQGAQAANENGDAIGVEAPAVGPTTGTAAISSSRNDHHHQQQQSSSMASNPRGDCNEDDSSSAAAAGVGEDTTNGFLNPTAALAAATNKAQRQQQQQRAEEGANQNQPKPAANNQEAAAAAVGVALASGTGSGASGGSAGEADNGGVTSTSSGRPTGSSDVPLLARSAQETQSASAPAPIIPLQQEQLQQPQPAPIFPLGVLPLDPAAAAAAAIAMRVSATAAAAPFVGGVHNLIPAPGGGHHVHPHAQAHAHARAAQHHAAAAMQMQAHLGGFDGAQQGGGVGGHQHYSNNHSHMTHNLIPGYVPPVYASAQQQQQQQQPAAAQGAAALAVAHHQQQPYPAPAQQQLYHQQQQQQQNQQQPNLIAADPRVSPLSFYGPAAAAPGAPGGGITALPASWIASQHPLVPLPPNVPGLPYYGLPVDPTSGKPYQTLQDMISSLGQGNVIPTYNGINTSYPGVRMISNPDTALMGGAGSTVPPVYAVDNFLTPAECDYLIAAAGDSFTPAPVVGKGVGEVSVSRTSSTVYLAREDLPLYLEKVCRLVGKPRDHCELPQVGRYFPSQQYMQHFDAFDLSNEDGQRFASNGGQRTVTVLVYLNDVAEGGSTSFPALNLDVRPRRGMALVFFPATTDGLLDKNALHAALPAVDTKYVSQVWIRQGNYDGLPTKRIFANEEIARRAAQTYCSSSNPLASGIERLQLPAQQPLEVAAASAACRQLICRGVLQQRRLEDAVSITVTKTI